MPCDEERTDTKSVVLTFDEFMMDPNAKYIKIPIHLKSSIFQLLQQILICELELIIGKGKQF